MSFSSMLRSIIGDQVGLDRDDNLLIKGKKLTLNHMGTTPGTIAGGATTQVGTSRALTADDNGQTLECTATVTLTVPVGLEANFGCAVIPNGTTSIASSGGALLNGATSTLTRAAANNPLVAIVARASAVDSYVVTGS